MEIAPSPLNEINYKNSLQGTNAKLK